ncbi:hypothetical protein OESDEN_01459 [Oesophagostomum dentatum]|uniref:Uncharacterized protein n=1 Tax=Oesophagostomum dentatum TaxID=61180 RepID=A0A0B1TR12_OESDE|nr:hypothetical protein OESDEN_01459 [Oesophagostomum dentatum]
MGFRVTTASGIGTLQLSGNQPSASYDDTDVDESVSSLLRDDKEETCSEEDDSSDDSYYPRVCDQQHDLIDKQRKMAFRGRMLVGNRQLF